MAKETPETDAPADNLQALDNLDRMANEEPNEREADPWTDQAEDEREADEQERAKQQAAEQGAALAVAFTETLVTMKYPYVVIDTGSKAQVEEKTSAVLYKHGGGLPEWLEPYREEIELGMVLAVAGFGVISQIAEHENREADREQSEQSESGEAGESLDAYPTD